MSATRQKGRKEEKKERDTNHHRSTCASPTGGKRGLPLTDTEQKKGKKKDWERSLRTWLSLRENREKRKGRDAVASSSEPMTFSNTSFTKQGRKEKEREGKAGGRITSLTVPSGRSHNFTEEAKGGKRGEKGMATQSMIRGLWLRLIGDMNRAG